MTRRCLVCGKINPCVTHTESEQLAELKRNDAAIADIRATQAKTANAVRHSFVMLINEITDNPYGYSAYVTEALDIINKRASDASLCRLAKLIKDQA